MSAKALIEGSNNHDHARCDVDDDKDTGDVLLELMHGDYELLSSVL